MRHQEPIQNIQVYESQLKAFSLFLSGNIHDANDLYQETVMRSILHQNSFRSGTNCLAWMKTIMKNTFINNYNLQNRRRSLRYENTNLINLRLGHGVDPQRADQLLQVQELQQLINQLPAKFSIPMKLLFKGYKYREVAGELDVPIGTVKSRVFEGRQILTNRIQALYSL